MADSVFDRDRKIRAAKLSMPQTFYLVTLNQFIGKNPDGWPSQTTLADAMNATKRSVQNWQVELEQLGVIQVDVGKGRSSTNRYRLNLDSLPAKDERRSPLNDEPHSLFTTPEPAQMTNDVRRNDERRSPEMTNDVRTERTIERTKKEQAFSFPPELNSEQFQIAWSEWVAYRRQIKKKLPPPTISKQLAKLAKWGPTKAIQSIELSISNGWQGLFDPDAKRGNGNSAGNSAALQAWQKIQNAAHEHHGSASAFEAAIGPKLAGIVRALRLTRLKIDLATDFEKQSQEREFIQAFSRQGAAA